MEIQQPAPPPWFWAYDGLHEQWSIHDQRGVKCAIVFTRATAEFLTQAANAHIDEFEALLRSDPAHDEDRFSVEVCEYQKTDGTTVYYWQVWDLDTVLCVGLGRDNTKDDARESARLSIDRFLKENPLAR